MGENNETSASRNQNPLGLRLLYKLRGHESWINEMAWSPDGQTLASPSYDQTIRLWDTQTGRLIHNLTGHKDKVWSVSWSPNGQTLSSASSDLTIRLWDALAGRQLRKLEGHKGDILSVAWAPNGETLASSSHDQTIVIWDPESGRPTRILKGHRKMVRNVAWSPDGRKLASASDDNDIRIWDAPNSKQLRILTGHGNRVWNVAWSPDGRTLASASEDKTIRIWNSETGNVLADLEAHTDPVICVCFSPDGRLLASRGRDSLRLWHCDSWEQVAFNNGNVMGDIGGLAFHPLKPELATFDEEDFLINIWHLDYAILLGARAFTDTRHYRNAKVVLVGDRGVGKTGLSLVLTGQPWCPTESTHGRHVLVFDSHEASLQDGRREMRETLLWDLAGQPGYRLIHQLHLNEVAVALVVFDARSETDPFSGVRYWDRALRQAQKVQDKSAVPMKKYLVAALADRGGIPVSRERIEATVRELGFNGFFETSAKEGQQIPELIAAIRQSIAWDGLPHVSSRELFQTIKEFLIAEKEAGRLLSTADDLYCSFCQIHPEQMNDKELPVRFETCMGRVENRDLIRRLSFGGYVLLQPELLDAYASAMVNAARSEPDGLGCIAEEDALAGRFTMPIDERVKNKDQENLVLIATVEELLRHEIVLKETTDAGADLVFPSQFTRERPDAPEPQGKAVVFTFEGPVLNVYTTLAVRLSRSRLFQKLDMWKNAASYRASVGGVCGIYMREVEEGRGELALFFDEAASEAMQYQFEDYVAVHLQRRALPNSVFRRRIFLCPMCGVIIPDEQSKRRRERGFTEMNCPVCDTRILLLDKEERVAAATVARTGEVIAEMDKNADEKRDRDLVATILKGKIEARDYDVFLCHNNKDKPEVKKIGERLKERGILPWLDEWELRPGLPFQRELEKQIKTIKAAAVFVGPDGFGPWHFQEQEAFLRQFVTRGCPVIPVILPGRIETPELPAFLEGMVWVDFRKLEVDPFDQLVWGITGERDDRR